MNGAKSLHFSALDLADGALAERLLGLQRAAYAVEADLVGSDEIPPLRETLGELVTCGETFLAAWQDDVLVGAVSWKVVDGVLDLHRLVVSPGSFRRGVGRALVREALRLHPGLPAIVQTGAANDPALALYANEGFSRVDEIEPVPGLRVARLKRPAG